MFIGQYKYNLDEKNRLVIPLEYRKELGNKVVINKGFEKCITIYPIDVWNELVEKMSSLAINQKDNRAFARYYMSSAFYKDFDSQGRISIDEVLRKYAGITSENKGCVVAGANKIIEIWTQDAWERIEAERDENFSDISENIIF